LAENYGLENVKKWENIPSTIIKEKTNHIYRHDMLIRDDWSEANAFVKTVTSDIIDILINRVRMNFPERKWHKDTTRILSATELVNLYNKCISGCLQALETEISLFMYISDNDSELFNNIFDYKISLIHSLKEKRI
jgi:hypothetical protein